MIKKNGKKNSRVSSVMVMKFSKDMWMIHATPTMHGWKLVLITFMMIKAT